MTDDTRTPARSMTYGDYLHLDKVLNAQFPLTGAHDEMLFIVQHQASEIWMRLAIHVVFCCSQKIACRSRPRGGVIRIIGSRVR